MAVAMVVPCVVVAGELSHATLDCSLAFLTKAVVVAVAVVVGDGQWSLVAVRIDGWLVEVVDHDC